MHRSRSRAFTLIELLTTVAVLVIVLGLMVSLARYARGQSSSASTRRLMVKLDGLVNEFWRQTGEFPQAPPLIDDQVEDLDEQSLHRHAQANSRALVSELGRQMDLGDLPISLHRDATIRDAWGTPIVYMAPGARNIRTAPQERYFLLSAGPDRQFLTREDNLYSYEQVPGGGGQGEQWSRRGVIP